MALPLRGMFGRIAATAVAGLVALTPSAVFAQKAAEPGKQPTKMAQSITPASSRIDVRDASMRAQDDSKARGAAGFSFELGRDSALFKQIEKEVGPGKENTQNGLEQLTSQVVGANIPQVVHFDIRPGNEVRINVYIAGKPHVETATKRFDLNLEAFATEGGVIAEVYSRWAAANSSLKREF